MAPTLHIRVTPQRVRVELDGAGVLLDEEAAVALRYDARVGDAQLLAVGRDAVALPERLHTLGRAAAAEDDFRSRVVPVAEAAWWDRLRGVEPAGDPARRDADPWEHHGEIVVATPFAPETLAPRLWPLLLRHIRHGAFAGDAGRRLGLLRRLRLRWRAPVAVEIPALPADTTSHDLLVRLLWHHFGSRVQLNGARAALRAPTRLSQLTLEDWKGIAAPLVIVATFVVAALLKGKAHLLLRPPMQIFLAACVTLSLALLRLTLRQAATEPSSNDAHARNTTQALRRHAVTGAVRDPATYASQGSFRLGLGEGAGGLLVTAAMMALATLVVIKVAGDRPLGGAGRFVVLLGAIGASGWLSLRLSAARLAIGERGITLRLLGWFSRPLRVPYTRIRQVAAVTGVQSALLRIVLQDGHEVQVGFAQKTETRMRRLRDLEATLTARLTSPGSYRAPGGGAAG